MIYVGPSLAVLGFASKKQEKELEISEEDQEKRKYQQMINHLYAKAREAMQRKKFVAADKIFHEALDFSKELLDEGKITQKDHLNHIAFLYAEMGNNSLMHRNQAGAEKLFKEGIASAIQLGMAPNDNAIIEMSLKIADIYAASGEDDLAVSGYRFCIQEQERKVKENENIDDNSKGLLGMSYWAYGRYLSNKGKFPQAKKAFTKSLEISKELLGEGDNRVLNLMGDLGNVMILMEDYDGAEALFKEGIKKGRKYDAEVLSALYCNLGALYLRWSRILEAETACKLALSHAEKQKDSLFKKMADNCLLRIQQIKTKEKLAKSN